ncbi:MAG TPA: hypothetical protein VF592_04175 [Sphingomonas sp.]|uniref:hypothetical protein n=1 Tax=Sphingomonas sp. TaxID=28214 RepID=UPI002EDA5AB3
MRLAALVMLAATASNLVFNMVAAHTGHGPPYSIFLYDLSERYDDFFKFILSFPAPGPVAWGPWMRDRVAQWEVANPFAGIAALRAGGLTHLFVPPLTALYCLLNAAAMRAIDPTLLFGATLAALWAYWAWLAARFDGAGKLAWIGLGTISYPMLMMATRGNVYAGVTALLIIHALWLSIRGRSPATAAILLALAVNIRPNAIVFALPLIALQPLPRRAAVTLVVAGSGLFAASLLGASMLYPDYSLSSFIQGLSNYYDFYVIGDLGLAYGSSLYGALKLMLGYRPGLDLLAAAVAFGLIGIGAWLHWCKPLASSSMLFLVLAAYTLGSTVITDYHLLVFVLVPAALAVEPRPLSRAGGAALIASCLMLAPKNYLFIDGVSLQVVINPAILLVAASLVIVSELRARRLVPAPSPTMAG